MLSVPQPWHRHFHTLRRHIAYDRHLSTARCNSFHIRHGATGRFATFVIPSPTTPPITTKYIHRKPLQQCTFSTQDKSTTTAISSSSQTTPPPTKKRGVFASLRHFLRTIFGANESSPRGMQERQDAYFVLLALEHNKLRLRWQSEQRRQRVVAEDDSTTSLMQDNDRIDNWIVEESKEHITSLLDRAASNLDGESSGIHDLSLGKLRREVQARMGDPIIRLLYVARLAEEEFRRTNDAVVMGSEDEDDYVFHLDRVADYKQVLWREYENVHRKMKEGEAGSAEGESGGSILSSQKRQFYRIKKGAIERLFDYYDWWPPEHDSNEEFTELNDGEQDEFGFRPSQFRSDVIPAMRYHHSKNLVRSYYARHYGALQNRSSRHVQQQQQQQFSIIALKSTIPNAGRGVYIDGKAIAGTLLAFFPGKIWPKEHLMSASLQTQRNLSENDPRHQLSIRYDDILIDSRRSPYTVVDNMWALGHVVNHPPAPTMIEQMSSGEDPDSSPSTQRHYRGGPNCVTVPIDFTEKMLEQHPELRRYIPNEYELPPQAWAKNAFDTENVIMNGMGIIALRDVQDEELFYDYRLSPDESIEGKGSGQYPKWYHVWDENAMKNRWSTDD
ncbi:hypothetical protein HJC23_010452 [Cyclotella cryptica]|uniref:SET domain-containing protein n=1 Tax=Cyclotella cryptica TaxID=29204 RepID=A0ABD3QIC8_9STRA|eukprot:CCRYP_005322-RA/>CCRYP_005322-RA protein AED:0.00 eAED:0.00 QI:155/-1/1/1/-1/1/1/100/613